MCFYEDELCAGEGGIAVGGDDQATVWSPPGGLGVAIPGSALGKSAFNGNGVNLAGTFVVGAEGN